METHAATINVALDGFTFSNHSWNKPKAVFVAAERHSARLLPYTGAAYSRASAQGCPAASTKLLIHARIINIVCSAALAVFFRATCCDAFIMGVLSCFFALVGSSDLVILSILTGPQTYSARPRQSSSEPPVAMHSSAAASAASSSSLLRSPCPCSLRRHSVHWRDSLPLSHRCRCIPAMSARGSSSHSTLSASSTSRAPVLFLSLLHDSPLASHQSSMHSAVGGFGCTDHTRQWERVWILFAVLSQPLLATSRQSSSEPPLSMHSS